jgi:23S rRNA (guanine745-N1)-methyltransferase
VISYRCPHCPLILDDNGDGWACRGGHRFDRAREGYANLLPGGRLKGRPAGDDGDMVRARRRFFDHGHYRPVMDAVADMAASVSPRFVLDAGCGEGSYLAQVCERTGSQGWGFDVSKPAIKLAARRYEQQHFSVASSYVVPFDDDEFDVAISVFSPRHFPELHRVVRRGGVIVIASPGPGHLDGLTQWLYNDPRPHAPKQHTERGGEHGATEVERVQFELSLEPQDAVDLLQMTPYWWSATPEQQQRCAQQPLVTTVDIMVSLHHAIVPSRAAT